jgi:hypothetical protein
VKELSKGKDAISAEEYLRKEEGPPEVVSLPANVQRLKEKQEGLRLEIVSLNTQVHQLMTELETRQLAFNQCKVLLEQELET